MSRRCLLLAALVAALIPTTALANNSWPTYHVDPARSGNANEPPTDTMTGYWTSPALDASMYAEPLYDSGKVIVATENNTIYALDGASGAVSWSMHLATPKTHGFPSGCGNINPLGITGTPVIDTASGTLFALADVEDSVSAWHFELFAITLSSHTIAWQRDVTPPGIDMTVQQARGALTLTAGRIEMVWGGVTGDCGTYHGYVESVPESGAAGPYPIFQTTPLGGDIGAGIWAPGGASVDPVTGTLYVASGNSTSTPGAAPDYSDSVIGLDPTTLSVRSWFAPSQWVADDNNDSDLGSVTPEPVGNGHVFIVGKSGVGYLLNGAALGGVGGDIAHSQVCQFSSDAAFGAITYIPPIAYVPCYGGVTPVRISSTGFTVLPRTTSPAQGPPIYAGGLIWSTDTIDGSGSNLYALDPSNLSEFTHFAVGTLPHFCTPMAAGGLVVVAQDTGATSHVVALHAAPGVPTNSGYVMDGYGGLHPYGGDPTVSTTAYWPGWRIARGLVLRADGDSGYTFDGYGALHPFGTPGGIPGQPPGSSGLWNWDIGRAVALRSDGASGYILDGFGGVHAFGGAPSVNGTAYWPGWDIARGIVLRADGQSGFVLDGYGGLHPFGAPGDVPAASTDGPRWGWDIARSVVLRSDGVTGYILDGFGGLHPFGGAPGVAGTAYWGQQHWDIARSLTLRADGQSGYVLDGYGGLHPYGAAPATPASAYWPGWDIARSAV